MRLKLSYKNLLIGLGIILMPALVYGVMWLTVYMAPPGSDLTYPALAGVAIILIGVFLPYLMLKGIFFNAHLINPREKEITLKDLPKDQDVIQAEEGHHTHKKYAARK